MGTNIEQMPGTNYRRTLKTGRVQDWVINQTDASVTLGASATLYQEFGDTKTRLVYYQATATSRFREYFPESLQSNPANFTNATPAAMNPLPSSGYVRIPSTARPSHPNVLYVVPTYNWTSSTSPPTAQQGAIGTTTNNVRYGGGLRVFVDRPWFTSGDTEYLGVLVNPQSPGSAPLPPPDYVSQWGYDPIRNPMSEPLKQLDNSQVSGGAGPVPNVPLAEGVGNVEVVPFAPTAFDPVRKLWYFDILLNENTLEAPFVRLALARYQPNSINPGISLSTVVRADMVKLSADRNATYLTNNDGSIAVTVSGRVFSNESWVASGAAIVSNTYAGNAASGRVLMAQVMESTAASPGEFDWTPIGNAVALTPNQTPGETTAGTYISFIGSVPKPLTAIAGAKHHLLITEHEVFFTDSEAAFPGPQAVTGFPGGALQPFPLPPPPALPIRFVNTTSRILFSDVLPLPY